MIASWAIAKREIASFFMSPVAYVVLTTWLLWTGLSFYLLASFGAGSVSAGGSDNPLAYFFGRTTLFFIPQLVFVPVITMRLLAAETASGTIEMLMTAPVREWEVIAGKYVAAMTFWVALWLPTVLYVWLTSRYGDVDLGAIGASYVGILGMGAYYMAFGLLASVVARNQIVAAILTFLFVGMLFGMGMLQYVVTESRDLFSYLSVWSHMQDFSKGILDTRYLVYDVSLAALALFFATRSLEARRLT